MQQRCRAVRVKIERGVNMHATELDTGRSVVRIDRCSDITSYLNVALFQPLLLVRREAPVYENHRTLVRRLVLSCRRSETPPCAHLMAATGVKLTSPHDSHGDRSNRGALPGKVGPDEVVPSSYELVDLCLATILQTESDVIESVNSINTGSYV